MRKPITLVLIFCSLNPLVKAQVESFVPFPEPYLRLVQGISLDVDNQTLFFTLNYREWLQHHREEIDEHTPRLAIFQSIWMGHQWGYPELLPFSGTFKDYEPTISPDGKYLFFNSNRPQQGSKPEVKNNMWYVERKGNNWSEPQNLPRINTPGQEESYPTMTMDGQLIIMKEDMTDAGVRYDLYETVFNGASTKSGVKVLADDQGSCFGDPAISPDGSYMLFTMFDCRDWESTCDLVISTWENGGWSAPEIISELNSKGPDFSPFIDPTGEWVYYRRNYSFVKVSVSLLSEYL